MRVIQKPPDEEFQRNEPMLAALLPPDGHLLEYLTENVEATVDFVQSLPSSTLVYRYAPAKWTIKEIIGHLMDMERIYGYRMLRFARNDQTPLPGFDADTYVKYSGANEREINDLLAELKSVRQSTLSLLRGLTDEALLRFGNMNGHRVSVRALAYHIAGHELHHMNIIRERYLEH